MDAVPAFWNAEGVALKAARAATRTSSASRTTARRRIPRSCWSPSRKTLEAKRARIAEALDAIAGGLEATREHPDEAVAMIAKAAETDDTELVRAQLDAVLPRVRRRPEGWTAPVLEQWADFDARIGLVKERPDVDQRVRLLAARL